MKNKIVMILAVIALAAVIFYFSSSGGSPRVCMKDTCFEVEIARTPEERSLGLMHRESLERDKGMLFVYEQEGIHPFWMKNTLIPLDMIWISKDKKVAYIAANAQPCREEACKDIIPEAESLYVLEVNAGVADEIGLKPGDTVIL